MANVLGGLIGILASTAALCAHAQTAQAPTPAKELIVKTCTTDFIGRDSSCQTRQFLEQRGDDFAFLITDERTGASGELLVTNQLGNKIRPFSPATFVPHSYMLQFPMEVGTRWSGTYDQTSAGETRRRTRSARVTGYSDLVLKAGTFKAFRIVATNQWNMASSPAREVYFYCPDLQIVCKYESPEFNLKWEVVEVSKASR